MSTALTVDETPHGYFTSWTDQCELIWSSVWTEDVATSINVLHSWCYELTSMQSDHKMKPDSTQTEIPLNKNLWQAFQYTMLQHSTRFCFNLCYYHFFALGILELCFVCLWKCHSKGVLWIICALKCPADAFSTLLEYLSVILSIIQQSIVGKYGI